MTNEQRKRLEEIRELGWETGEDVHFLLQLVEELKGPRGNWVCDECACTMATRVLNAKTGQIGVDGDVPVCPNQCGPMRGMTWPEADANADATIDRLLNERDRYTKALVGIWAAWDMGFDCSQDPGHTQLNAALDEFGDTIDQAKLQLPSNFTERPANTHTLCVDCGATYVTAEGAVRSKCPKCGHEQRGYNLDEEEK